MRSWVLRPPSPSLKRRLFPHARVEKSPSPGFALGWLAPATALILLFASLMNPRLGPSLNDTTNTQPLVAIIVSNQSAGVSFSNALKHDETRFRPSTFDWTNGDGSTSSIRSLSGSREKF